MNLKEKPLFKYLHYYFIFFFIFIFSLVIKIKADNEDYSILFENTYFSIGNQSDSKYSLSDNVFINKTPTVKTESLNNFLSYYNESKREGKVGDPNSLDVFNEAKEKNFLLYENSKFVKGEKTIFFLNDNNGDSILDDIKNSGIRYINIHLYSLNTYQNSQENQDYEFEEIESYLMDEYILDIIGNNQYKDNLYFPDNMGVKLNQSGFYYLKFIFQNTGGDKDHKFSSFVVSFSDLSTNNELDLNLDTTIYINENPGGESINVTLGVNQNENSLLYSISSIKLVKENEIISQLSTVKNLYPFIKSYSIFEFGLGIKEIDSLIDYHIEITYEMLDYHNQSESLFIQNNIIIEIANEFNGTLINDKELVILNEEDFILKKGSSIVYTVKSSNFFFLKDENFGDLYDEISPFISYINLNYLNHEEYEINIDMNVIKINSNHNLFSFYNKVFKNLKVELNIYQKNPLTNDYFNCLMSLDSLEIIIENEIITYNYNFVFEYEEESDIYSESFFGEINTREITNLGEKNIELKIINFKIEQKSLYYDFFSIYDYKTSKNSEDFNYYSNIRKQDDIKINLSNDKKHFITSKNNSIANVDFKILFDYVYLNSNNILELGSKEIENTDYDKFSYDSILFNEISNKDIKYLIDFINKKITFSLINSFNKENYEQLLYKNDQILINVDLTFTNQLGIQSSILYEDLIVKLVDLFTSFTIELIKNENDDGYVDITKDISSDQTDYFFSEDKQANINSNSTYNLKINFNHSNFNDFDEQIDDIISIYLRSASDLSFINENNFIFNVNKNSSIENVHKFDFIISKEELIAVLKKELNDLSKEDLFEYLFIEKKIVLKESYLFKNSIDNTIEIEFEIFIEVEENLFDYKYDFHLFVHEEKIEETTINDQETFLLMSVTDYNIYKFFNSDNVSSTISIFNDFIIHSEDSDNNRLYLKRDITNIEKVNLIFKPTSNQDDDFIIDKFNYIFEYNNIEYRLYIKKSDNEIVEFDDFERENAFFNNEDFTFFVYLFYVFSNQEYELKTSLNILGIDNSEIGYDLLHDYNYVTLQHPLDLDELSFQISESGFYELNIYIDNENTNIPIYFTQEVRIKKIPMSFNLINGEYIFIFENDDSLENKKFYSGIYNKSDEFNFHDYFLSNIKNSDFLYLKDSNFYLDFSNNIEYDNLNLFLNLYYDGNLLIENIFVVTFEKNQNDNLTHFYNNVFEYDVILSINELYENNNELFEKNFDYLEIEDLMFKVNFNENSISFINANLNLNYEGIENNNLNSYCFYDNLNSNCSSEINFEIKYIKNENEETFLPVDSTFFSNLNIIKVPSVHFNYVVSFSNNNNKIIVNDGKMSEGEEKNNFYIDSEKFYSNFINIIDTIDFTADYSRLIELEIYFKTNLELEKDDQEQLYFIEKYIKSEYFVLELIDKDERNLELKKHFKIDFIVDKLETDENNMFNYKLQIILDDLYGNKLEYDFDFLNIKKITFYINNDFLGGYVNGLFNDDEQLHAFSWKYLEEDYFNNFNNLDLEKKKINEIEFNLNQEYGGSSENPKFIFNTIDTIELIKLDILYISYETFKDDEYLERFLYKRESIEEITINKDDLVNYVIDYDNEDIVEYNLLKEIIRTEYGGEIEEITWHSKENILLRVSIELIENLSQEYRFYILKEDTINDLQEIIYYFPASTIVSGEFVGYEASKIDFFGFERKLSIEEYLNSKFYLGLEISYYIGEELEPLIHENKLLKDYTKENNPNFDFIFSSNFINLNNSNDFVYDEENYCFYYNGVNENDLNITLNNSDFYLFSGMLELIYGGIKLNQLEEFEVLLIDGQVSDIRFDFEEGIINQNLISIKNNLSNINNVYVGSKLNPKLDSSNSDEIDVFNLGWKFLLKNNWVNINIIEEDGVNPKYILLVNTENISNNNNSTVLVFEDDKELQNLRIQFIYNQQIDDYNITFVIYDNVIDYVEAYFNFSQNNQVENNSNNELTNTYGEDSFPFLNFLNIIGEELYEKYVIKYYDTSHEIGKELYFNILENLLLTRVEKISKEIIEDQNNFSEDDYIFLKEFLKYYFYEVLEIDEIPNFDIIFTNWYTNLVNLDSLLINSFYYDNDITFDMLGSFSSNKKGVGTVKFNIYFDINIDSVLYDLFYEIFTYVEEIDDEEKIIEEKFNEMVKLFSHTKVKFVFDSLIKAKDPTIEDIKDLPEIIEFNEIEEDEGTNIFTIEYRLGVEEYFNEFKELLKNSDIFYKVLKEESSEYIYFIKNEYLNINEMQFSVELIEKFFKSTEYLFYIDFEYNDVFDGTWNDSIKEVGTYSTKLKLNYNLKEDIDFGEEGFILKKTLLEVNFVLTPINLNININVNDFAKLHKITIIDENINIINGNTKEDYILNDVVLNDYLYFDESFQNYEDNLLLISSINFTNFNLNNILNNLEDLFTIEELLKFSIYIKNGETSYKKISNSNINISYFYIILNGNGEPKKIDQLDDKLKIDNTYYSLEDSQDSQDYIITPIISNITTENGEITKKITFDITKKITFISVKDINNNVIFDKENIQDYLKDVYIKTSIIDQEDLNELLDFNGINLEYNVSQSVIFEYDLEEGEEEAFVSQSDDFLLTLDAFDLDLFNSNIKIKKFNINISVSGESLDISNTLDNIYFNFNKMNIKNLIYPDSNKDYINFLVEEILNIVDYNFNVTLLSNSNIFPSINDLQFYLIINDNVIIIDKSNYISNNNEITINFGEITNLIWQNKQYFEDYSDILNIKISFCYKEFTFEFISSNEIPLVPNNNNFVYDRLGNNLDKINFLSDLIIYLESENTIYISNQKIDIIEDIIELINEEEINYYFSAYNNEQQSASYKNLKSKVRISDLDSYHFNFKDDANFELYLNFDGLYFKVVIEKKDIVIEDEIMIVSSLYDDNKLNIIIDFYTNIYSTKVIKKVTLYNLGKTLEKTIYTYQFGNEGRINKIVQIDSIFPNGNEIIIQIEDIFGQIIERRILINGGNTSFDWNNLEMLINGAEEFYDNDEIALINIGFKYDGISYVNNIFDLEKIFGIVIDELKIMFDISLDKYSQTIYNKSSSSNQIKINLVTNSEYDLKNINNNKFYNKELSLFTALSREYGINITIKDNLGNTKTSNPNHEFIIRTNIEKILYDSENTTIKFEKNNTTINGYNKAYDDLVSNIVFISNSKNFINNEALKYLNIQLGSMSEDYLFSSILDIMNFNKANFEIIINYINNIENINSLGHLKLNDNNEFDYFKLKISLKSNPDMVIYLDLKLTLYNLFYVEIKEEIEEFEDYNDFVEKIITSENYNLLFKKFYNKAYLLNNITSIKDNLSITFKSSGNNILNTFDNLLLKGKYEINFYISDYYDSLTNSYYDGFLNDINNNKITLEIFLANDNEIYYDELEKDEEIILINKKQNLYSVNIDFQAEDIEQYFPYFSNNKLNPVEFYFKENVNSNNLTNWNQDSLLTWEKLNIENLNDYIPNKVGAYILIFKIDFLNEGVENQILYLNINVEYKKSPSIYFNDDGEKIYSKEFETNFKGVMSTEIFDPINKVDFSIEMPYLNKENIYDKSNYVKKVEIYNLDILNGIKKVGSTINQILLSKEGSYRIIYSIIDNNTLKESNKISVDLHVVFTLDDLSFSNYIDASSIISQIDVDVLNKGEPFNSSTYYLTNFNDVTYIKKNKLINEAFNLKVKLVVNGVSQNIIFSTPDNDFPFSLSQILTHFINNDLLDVKTISKGKYKLEFWIEHIHLNPIKINSIQINVLDNIKPSFLEDKYRNDYSNFIYTLPNIDSSILLKEKIISDFKKYFDDNYDKVNDLEFLLLNFNTNIESEKIVISVKDSSGNVLDKTIKINKPLIASESEGVQFVIVRGTKITEITIGEVRIENLKACSIDQIGACYLVENNNFWNEVGEYELTIVQKGYVNLEIEVKVISNEIKYDEFTYYEDGEIYKAIKWYPLITTNISETITATYKNTNIKYINGERIKGPEKKTIVLTNDVGKTKEIEIDFSNTFKLTLNTKFLETNKPVTKNSLDYTWNGNDSDLIAAYLFANNNEGNNHYIEVDLNNLNIFMQGKYKLFLKSKSGAVSEEMIINIDTSLPKHSFNINPIDNRFVYEDVILTLEEAGLKVKINGKIDENLSNDKKIIFSENMIYNVEISNQLGTSVAYKFYVLKSGSKIVVNQKEIEMFKKYTISNNEVVIEKDQLTMGYGYIFIKANADSTFTLLYGNYFTQEEINLIQQGNLTINTSALFSDSELVIGLVLPNTEMLLLEEIISPKEDDKKSNKNSIILLAGGGGFALIIIVLIVVLVKFKKTNTEIDEEIIEE